MANSISEADLKTMRELGQKALSDPEVIHGKPINEASEYIAISTGDEWRELRGAFMEGCVAADYYTSNRAMKALIILDMGARRLTEER